VSARAYGRGARPGGNSMADRVAARVDASRQDVRRFECGGCGLVVHVPYQLPTGWLNVGARVVVENVGRWEVLGVACSTSCLVALAGQLDARAQEAIGG
jgi:hypothetical protein